ncbi:MAG: 4-oxalocrotonate tautomerase family protein [Pseudomonadota bacterium]
MPLITIKLFEGRTQDQKKAVASGIMEVLERELGSKPKHNWIVFEDRSREDWFTGSESQTEIDARRKAESGGG